MVSANVAILEPERPGKHPPMEMHRSSSGHTPAMLGMLGPEQEARIRMVFVEVDMDRDRRFFFGLMIRGGGKVVGGGSAVPLQSRRVSGQAPRWEKTFERILP